MTSCRLESTREPLQSVLVGSRATHPSGTAIRVPSAITSSMFYRTSTPYISSISPPAPLVGIESTIPVCIMKYEPQPIVESPALRADRPRVPPFHFDRHSMALEQHWEPQPLYPMQGTSESVPLFHDIAFERKGRSTPPIRRFSPCRDAARRPWLHTRTAGREHLPPFDTAPLRVTHPSIYSEPTRSVLFVPAVKSQPL